jgi:hypothetical protein
MLLAIAGEKEVVLAGRGDKRKREGKKEEDICPFKSS